MFNTTWNLLVCKELPLNCPANYSLSFTKLKYREIFFLTLLWWEDFGLGAANYLYWHIQHRREESRNVLHIGVFCVSHEGSFIYDRVARFGLWSVHFCIWRQMRLKRYAWGKEESMEKKKNSPDSGGNLWPQSLLLLSSDGFRVINWLHMLWWMGIIN